MKICGHHDCDCNRLPPMQNSLLRVALLNQSLAPEPDHPDYNPDATVCVAIDSENEKRGYVVIRIRVADVDWLCSHFRFKLRSKQR